MTFRILALSLCLAVGICRPSQDDTGGAPFSEVDKTGASLLAKREFAKAEELYRSALDRARQKGDRSWTAEFLRRIGETRQRMGDFKGALLWYEESLPIREALGQKPETAYLLVGTGFVKATLGDLEGATARAERGRAQYHELEDVPNENNALTLLAQIATRQNNFDKADQHYRALLASYQKLALPAGIASTHAARADLFFRRSQYRDALAEAFSAVDTASAAAQTLPAGDARRTLLTTQANALETAGNLWQRMVQNSRALDSYEAALRIRQELRDEEGAASTATNMAPLLIRMGKTGQAIAALDQALTVRRRLGNPANTAATLTARAQANLAEGKPEEARKKYEEALSLSRAGSNTQGVALYQLGVIAFDAGRLEEALQYHSRALEIRKTAGNPHDVVRSQNQIALLQERRGDLAKAEAAHVEALNGFEKLSQEISDPVQLASFRETAAQLYPGYAHVLFRQGRVADALGVAERSRGQVLARMFGAQGASFQEKLTAEQRARWVEAASVLAKAANRFRAAIERSAAESERADAHAAWLDAKGALIRTRDRLFSENPQFAGGASSQVRVAGLQELSRRNPRTLYLEWLVVNANATLLFSLQAGEVKGHLLSAGSAQLRQTATDWRTSLLLGNGRGLEVLAPATGRTRPEPECANEMFRAMAGPLAETLESGGWNRLVAVTDGPLLDIPLAALVTNQGKRLIERFAITSATSLHSLLAEPDRPAATADLMVVGDPLEPGKDRAVVPSGDRFRPLDHARAEAADIASLFRGAIHLTGTAASEARVKQRLDCCSILHFATHGVLDADDGMDSGLLLAGESGDATEDGVLQAWEIAGMRLHAKLAVLSACNTARGDRRLGEGLMGLAWAFQAAGTPAVVASLWSVDDAATSELMRAFYGELRSGAGKDEALQRAMLKMQAGGKRAPYYWAGFSVIGRPDPIR